VGLIDDDGEVAALMLGADVIENVGKLLHRCDDDLLARRDRPAQVSRAVRVDDCRADLQERLDGLRELIVKDHAVGDDDDGVEGHGPLVSGLDKLVHEPGDRVRLATARRVLDEVPPTRPALGDIGEQLSHYVKLVIAREDRLRRAFTRLRVLLGDDLRVVLDDAGETLRGKDSPPQVVGHHPVSVGRVTSAVVEPLVEGQEP